MKILFTLALFFSLCFAKSYHFSELRYSDAFAQTQELRGLITFAKERLEISYAGSSQRIIYADAMLRVLQDKEEIELGSAQSARLSHFFELLLLLYENREEKIKKLFVIKQSKEKKTLTPRGDLGEYILKIETQRERQNLKRIKLFLSNDDTIEIKIEDETE